MIAATDFVARFGVGLLASVGLVVVVAAVTAAVTNELVWFRRKRSGRRIDTLMYRRSWRGRLRTLLVENHPRIALLRYPELRRVKRVNSRGR